MADESPLDMEQIAAIDDPKALEAEIARRAGTPAEPEKPAETVKVVVEPEPAKPAEEAKPIEAAKPVEEVKSAAETKPAEQPVEPKPTADNAWKRVRLLEKEIKELREASKPKADAALDTPKAPTYEDDPAEYLKARTGELEAEVNRLRTENQQKERLNTIRSQESDFERAHPDYRQALTYLETDEIKDWEESGVATVGVQRLNQYVQAGRRGDRAYKPYADHVDSIASQPAVQELAAKDGRDPEDMAMWLVARDTYLTERRQLVWQGAEATGKNPAEIAYTLAQRRGYKSPAPAEPAKPVAAAESADAARARVLRQQQISEATNSLSESSSADGGPQPRVLRNRNEVLNLDEASLDALIESRQYRNL